MEATGASATRTGRGSGIMVSMSGMGGDGEPQWAEEKAGGDKPQWHATEA
jgi:hypothetical protein